MTFGFSKVLLKILAWFSDGRRSLATKNARHSVSIAWYIAKPLIPSTFTFLFQQRLNSRRTIFQRFIIWWRRKQTKGRCNKRERQHSFRFFRCWNWRWKKGRKRCGKRYVIRENSIICDWSLKVQSNEPIKTRGRKTCNYVPSAGKRTTLWTNRILMLPVPSAGKAA